MMVVTNITIQGHACLVRLRRDKPSRSVYVEKSGFDGENVVDVCQIRPPSLHANPYVLRDAALQHIVPLIMGPDFKSCDSGCVWLAGEIAHHYLLRMLAG